MCRYLEKDRYTSFPEYCITLRWQDPVDIVNYYQVSGDNEFGAIKNVYTQVQAIQKDTIRQTFPFYFGD
ncbi:hypothetical protein GCM10023187_53950 [Nibrella viscosa]|uniref:Uncharacterized protein n=1 Tax=Nibrella viscosa TaxID=1084524 RepID=A0ABP8KZ22_9BACT